MKYAKLKNGIPAYARNPFKLDTPVVIDGVEHSGYLSTNREDVLLRLGYKPVQLTELEAEEGFDYVQTWEETEAAIVRVWTPVKIEETELS